MSSLQEALSQRKSRLEEKVVTPGAASGSGRGKKNKGSTARKNTHLIGGHFPREVAHQWHLLVAEEKINGATGQSLLEEALSDLFVKKGKKALRKVTAI